MTLQASIALSASRLLVVAGQALCALIAFLLVIVAVALLVAWPEAITAAVAHSLDTNARAMQPWISFGMLGGAVIVGLAALVFHRLHAILKTVSAGDPFVAANVSRLRQIGWMMLAVEGSGLFTGMLFSRAPNGDRFGMEFGLSFSAILAVLLAFVLAEVFEKARAMRDDLEGTV